MKYLGEPSDTSWWVYPIWIGVSLIQMPMIFFREMRHLKVFGAAIMVFNLVLMALLIQEWT